MLFKTIVTSFLLAVVPMASAKVWDIVVGGDAGLVYTPNQVDAEIGDTLHFIFHAKNHTVTQGAFTKPCVPLKGGFNSGFMPVSPDKKSDFPTFDVHVKSKKPIFIHCEQTGHCPAGMVFAANAGKHGHSFDNYLALAKQQSPDLKRSYDYPPHIARDAEQDAEA